MQFLEGPPQPDNRVGAKIARVFDRLPLIRRQQKEQQQLQQELIEAVLAKTIGDIEEYGYTTLDVRKNTPVTSINDIHDEYLSEYMSDVQWSRVLYVNGDNHYFVTLAAQKTYVRDRGERFGLTPGFWFEVSLTLGDKSEKPSDWRMAFINREVPLQKPDENVHLSDLTTSWPTHMFMADEQRSIKSQYGDTHQLPTKDAIAFLRELLGSRVDEVQTRIEFNQERTKVAEGELKEAYWNRDFPGKMLVFDINPKGSK